MRRLPRTGQAHLEARGGKTTIPHAFSLMQPKQILNDCLGCHARDFNRVNIRRSEHTQNDVACTSCHSIHHSATPKFLLAKQQRELCYGCHSTIRAQFEMPSKHRVNEGFMKCTDCHNPHGAFAPTWRMADRPTMVEQAVANDDACIKCHADKRGPFAFEHPPVRVEGCEMCHSPHGSTNSRLLRRPVVFTLCLECHNGAPRTSAERFRRAELVANPQHARPEISELHELPCENSRLEFRSALSEVTEMSKRHLVFLIFVAAPCQPNRWSLRRPAPRARAAATAGATTTSPSPLNWVTAGATSAATPTCTARW